MITQPTNVPPGNNTKVSGSNTESLVHDVTQSHISNQASTNSHPIPQDRWSRDQHINLVNIIGDPVEGMFTKSMVAKLTAASASECLFADFFSEIEPKKVSEALKHLGWVDTMQEELNQFYRNKEQERRAWHNHQKQSDDVPSSLAWRPPLRARMGSSPNCTLKPSNNFEWRKTVFEIVTTMGIRQTLRGKAFDETRAEVIQALAFPQASQELFDPIEA
ncbi:hypothetical protein Tco_1266276 [Tanacetum coccineum]